MDRDDPIGALSDALAAEIPSDADRAIAIVDSPRCPIDVDSSCEDFVRRENPPRGREIDLRLRAMIAALNGNAARVEKVRLSMFPTPPARYFIDCVSDRACRPHLARMWSALFEHRGASSGESAARKVSGGAVFTRFMIAGFAAHRALRNVGRDIGIDAFEGYPYLGFRLWMKRGETLPPKNGKRGAGESALEARQRILARIARTLGRFTMAAPATLDQADAAILALTMVAAANAHQIDDPAEGRFLVALDGRDAEALRDFPQMSAAKNHRA